MKRLATDFAVPNGAALVDGILADHALLLALGQSLHKVDALLRQVLELVEEVLVVVLHLNFVLRVPVSLPDKGDFLLSLNFSVVIAVKVLARRAKVVESALALLHVILLAAHLLGAFEGHLFLRDDLLVVFVLEQAIRVTVISLSLTALLVEVLTTVVASVVATTAPLILTIVVFRSWLLI